jgi:hypothetical protein
MYSNIRKPLFAPVALLLGVVAVVWVCNSGCYPDYGLTYADYDVVATRYDTTVDFGAFTTFYMPDTVFRVGDTLIDMEDRYDDELLKAVAGNFEALGYERVPLSATTPPDFAIAMAKSTSTTIYSYWYPWYGGWYPWYGWGGGWGGYYPWYPYAGGVGSYSQGSVFVQFIDPAKVDTTEKRYGIVWFGAVNGLLGDTPSGVASRLSSSINQMFTQSPYLGKTPQ